MSYNTQSILGISNHRQDISLRETAAVSLEDRLLHAYANESVNTAAEQREVMRLLEDRRVTSNPEALAELQKITSDYSLHISMISALARKGVGAVETLLRS